MVGVHRAVGGGAGAAWSRGYSAGLLSNSSQNIQYPTCLSCPMNKMLYQLIQISSISINNNFLLTSFHPHLVIFYVNVKFEVNPSKSIHILI